MDTETYGRRALLPSCGVNPSRTFTGMQSSRPQATDSLVHTDDNDSTGLAARDRLYVAGISPRPVTNALSPSVIPKSLLSRNALESTTYSSHHWVDRMQVKQLD